MCVTLGWLEEPFTSQVCLGLLLEAAKLPGLFYCHLSLPNWYSTTHVRFGVSRRAEDPQVGFYFGSVGGGGGENVRSQEGSVLSQAKK